MTNLKKNTNLIRSKWKMLNSGRQCSFISDFRPCGVIPFLAALYGPVNGVNYLLPSGQIWWLLEVTQFFYDFFDHRATLFLQGLSEMSFK